MDNVTKRTQARLNQKRENYTGLTISKVRTETLNIRHTQFYVRTEKVMLRRSSVKAKTELEVR